MSKQSPDQELRKKKRRKVSLHLEEVSSVEELFQKNLRNCDILCSEVARVLNERAADKLHRVSLKPETTLLSANLKRNQKFFVYGWSLPPKVGSSMVLLRSGGLLDFSPLNLGPSFWGETSRMPELWFDLAFSKATEFCERNGAEVLEGVFIDRLARYYLPELR
jgi:hypothetical protein